MKMRYIENFELREWVKENLKKAIIHKAHALAVQTGCEILVKLQDETDDINTSCYYATNHLDFSYNNNGLRRLPGEVSISGETGLPIISTVEKGIQSQGESKGDQTESTTSISISDEASINDAAVGQEETEMVTEEPSNQRTGGDLSNEQDGEAVPVSLDSFGLVVDPQSNDESTVNVKDEIDDGIVTIKTEVTDEEGDTGTLDMTSESVGGDEMQIGDILSQSFPSVTQSQSFPMVPISPKPYQCSMCHKAFRSIQVLQKHTQTFHMRPQSISMSRSMKGRGGLKQRQSVPLATEQRYQCTMCSRNFRHPALLDDHMNRSHMGFRGSQFSTATMDNSQSSTSALEQLSQSLPLQLGSDNSSMDSPSDSVLPQITSVSSLQHLAPSTVHTVASTSSAPFAQGSPMGPVFRHQSPSTSRTPPSRPSGSSNRINSPGQMNRKLPKIHKIMSGILLSASPVNTYVVFKQRGPLHLRRITKQQYIDAAVALEQSNLGAVVVSGARGVSFLKRPPSEVKEIIKQTFVGVFNYTYYIQRFGLPVPNEVTFSPALRSKIEELEMTGFISRSGKKK